MYAPASDASFVSGYAARRGHVDRHLEAGNDSRGRVRSLPAIKRRTRGHAVLGTQRGRVPTPNRLVDGVFALWYARAAGSTGGDALKHGKPMAVAARRRARVGV